MRPDRRTADIISQVFARRARGEPLADLCRHLESENVLTGLGAPGWSPSGLAYIIGMRVYLGEVDWGNYHRDHAHPALTDPATWEAAQHPRPLNINDGKHEPALLRGLVRSLLVVTP